MLCKEINPLIKKIKPNHHIPTSPCTSTKFSYGTCVRNFIICIYPERVRDQLLITGNEKKMFFFFFLTHVNEIPKNDHNINDRTSVFPVFVVKTDK